MNRAHVDRALLLARTTRNLRPAQVLHRARLRAQRFPPSRPAASALIARLPASDRTAPGWPDGYRALDAQLAEGYPSPEQNAQGTFAFLNQTFELGRPVQWLPPGASRLWVYHLHYMEWAWSFAAHPDPDWARAAFAELWRSWDRSVRFGSGDPWHPYVASLRAWVLCGVYSTLVAGSGIQSSVGRSLTAHARFLRWHVEHDVGGNHLVKNLKAMVALGVFLGDEPLRRKATAALERQLGVQVLPDGGHYERSPSYHCQVLGDLIDVSDLVAGAGHPVPAALTDAIDAMRSWLGVMLLPDGDVPLFNDCVLVGADRLSLLHPGPRARERLTVLASSGYVVARPDDTIHLVADVGDPCPPELPAHAHADCLSFELAIDGRRAVVDTGTSTYAPGPRRAYERSTAAHNTVIVDGADQTEVWAVFRAARLAHGQLEQAGDDGNTITVTASHDGYRRLPGSPVHRRTWLLSPAQIRIVDEISGEGEHGVDARLHLAGDGMVKTEWSQPAGVLVTEGRTQYATGFGRLFDGRLTSAAWRGRLPVTMAMELHVPTGPETMKGAT